MFPLFTMSVLLNSMSVSVCLLFMGKAAPGLGGIMLSTTAAFSFRRWSLKKYCLLPCTRETKTISPCLFTDAAVFSNDINNRLPFRVGVQNNLEPIVSDPRNALK